MRIKPFLVALGLALPVVRTLALTTDDFVSEQRSDGGFCLFAKNTPTDILVETNDWSGVQRAAADLQADVQRVSGLTPVLAHQLASPQKNVVIIGTIGKSEIIDRLVREKKITTQEITGQWESFFIQTVPQPFPGIDNALVICGSDKRGTIYGIYDISEQIGVSPWYFFADVPAKHHDKMFVRPGKFVQGPPAVKYRGIFLNDEAPCLAGWAKERYGGINHGCYTNIFELLLRLRANYLWPAMWDNSFATDDPLNAPLADEYGIVMGTSHHEPMMRAWKEWERAGHRKGSWDYSKNPEVLRDFWTEGIRRNRDYEKLITIGMRGDGDEPMSESESVSLLEKIVADQRQIITRELNTNADAVPQVWALYKEVQGYYERGMRVPDDVTLLWCDDNWGNLRRLPTDGERRRAGGAGIYYHLDYVGGPRNYKWLNTVPIPKIWEQMSLADQHGADRLWIVNVGDLKPLEFPMEFFLTFAWSPGQWPKEHIADFTRQWAAREFGGKYADDIADIVAKYTKYNGRRKPELLEPDTFSLENYHEADTVVADWQRITRRAESIYKKLPANTRDAFYELVLFPTKACTVVNELYVAVAKNHAYAQQGDARADKFAVRARKLFQEDAALSDEYNHKLAGGKWDHMMDQTHIGYTYWQQPSSNALPELLAVNPIKTIPAVALPQTKAVSSFIPKHGSLPGFFEANGYVSIEAIHCTKKTDTPTAHWDKIDDLGRTLSSMTIFPQTARSVSLPQDSPCLEYRMYLSSTGAVEVTSILSPSLNFDPDRSVRMAVAYDDEPPQVLTIVPKGYVAGDGNSDWEASVRDGVRRVKSQHIIANAGEHTFKVWMVDPAVVLQKIVVDCGGVKPSYLGPPESFHRP